ncbi:isochorismatase family protein [Streptomyces sp. Lzd4kr]|nr:isochorismatase family protein [Streptomyces sp. Lzd4kr]
MDRRNGPRGLALVVDDMINTYDHEDAELLVPSVRHVVPVLAELIGRAREAGVPVIYANDNFGLWRSHHGELVGSAKALDRPHADLIEPIRPDDRSLFVVKARDSAFYEPPHLASAALEMMERNMGAHIHEAKEIDFSRAGSGT